MRHNVRRHSRPTKKATTASAAKLRQRKKEIETETEKRRNEDEIQPSRNNNKPLSTVWHTLSRVTAATAVVVAEGLCCVWCGVITQSVCLSVRLSNSLACFLHVFMLPNIESGTGISNFPSSSVCMSPACRHINARSHIDSYKTTKRITPATAIDGNGNTRT